MWTGETARGQVGSLDAGLTVDRLQHLFQADDSDVGPYPDFPLDTLAVPLFDFYKTFLLQNYYTLRTSVRGLVLRVSQHGYLLQRTLMFHSLPSTGEVRLGPGFNRQRSSSRTGGRGVWLSIEETKDCGSLGTLDYVSRYGKEHKYWKELKDERVKEMWM